IRDRERRDSERDRDRDRGERHSRANSIRAPLKKGGLLRALARPPMDEDHCVFRSLAPLVAFERGRAGCTRSAISSTAPKSDLTVAANWTQSYRYARVSLPRPRWMKTVSPLKIAMPRSSGI